MTGQMFADRAPRLPRPPSRQKEKSPRKRWIKVKTSHGTKKYVYHKKTHHAAHAKKEKRGFFYWLKNQAKS